MISIESILYSGMRRVRNGWCDSLTIASKGRDEATQVTIATRNKVSTALDTTDSSLAAALIRLWGYKEGVILDSNIPVTLREYVEKFGVLLAEHDKRMDARWIINGVGARVLMLECDADRSGMYVFKLRAFQDEVCTRRSIFGKMPILRKFLHN